MIKWSWKNPMKARARTSITVRLSSDLIEALDRAAGVQTKSRSQIIEQALRAYLADAVSKPRSLMSYAGVGAKLSTYRSTEEVDAEIRWLRDSD
jgi:metal-responsive CopG/Arc/MetJ family transcriptional regulator